MNILNVPDFGGTWTWDGDLKLDTIITLANGFQMSLQAIITQTNGEALDWINFDLVKYSSDQPRDDHGRFSYSENADSVDEGHLSGEEIQAKIWDKAQSMTYIKSGQDPTAFAGAVKQAVSENILADMQNKGITFEELYKNEIQNGVGNPPNNPVSLPNALRFMASGQQFPESGTGKDYFIIAKTNDGGVTVLPSERFGILNNEPTTREAFAEAVNNDKYFINKPWAFLDSPEAKQLASEGKVSDLLASWANSANDSNLRSLAMQDVAVKTFGLKDTASWGYANSSISKSDVATEVSTNGKVYGAFLSAQYDATQKFLSDNKISSVEIYRGFTAQGSNIERLPFGDNVDVTTRPLSSWSTSENVASWFASPDNTPPEFADKTSVGAMFHSIVPASQILAFPITGIGCYGEDEVVLLGGTMKTDSSEWTGL
jgi:hypothetical protein